MAPLVRRYTSPCLVIRDRTFHWGERTYVMGVVNITPDSFSGDGVPGPAAAVARARQLEAEGADMLDLGAESSRPGAAEMDAAEEAARLIPALAAVRAATALPISVDTYHAPVAAAALAAGVDAVNDIHGLRRDPEMARVVAEAGVPVFAMHNQRGRPFHDVVEDIGAGVRETLTAAHAAGIERARVVIDPGFGFGWTPEQNLELVRRLPELWPLELPLLLGVSRKSTVGYVLNTAVDDRLEGTAALVALAIAGGADMVRVHDVRAMVRVARVADAAVRGTWRHRESERE